MDSPKIVRKADWLEVKQLFRDRPENQIQRSIDNCCRWWGRPSFEFNAETEIWLTLWTPSMLEEFLRYMAQYAAHMITKIPPRRFGDPLVHVKDNDRYFTIDGKKRANKIVREGKPKGYPVLEIVAPQENDKRRS